MLQPAPRWPRLFLSGAILLCSFLGPAVLAATDLYETTVDPARPHEGEPFVLAIGGLGSCPTVYNVLEDPDPEGGGTVGIELVDQCLSVPTAFLLDVPLGPLAAGPWTLEVFVGGGPPAARRDLTVAPLPYALRVPPPGRIHESEQLTLVFEGSSLPCWHLETPRLNGHLVTIDAFLECNILPPPPGPFEIPVELPALPPGAYRAQIETTEGETLASARFDVLPEGACIPDPDPDFGTVLCLQDGRFRVTAAWSTGGEPAVGYAVPQTRDTGGFFFFDQENLELQLKVLDACRGPAPRFWVFTAGLTNVGVDLRVEDTLSGEVWLHSNPLGEVFQPVLDTDAFATCSVP